MLHVWNIYLHMAYIYGTYELNIGKYSSPMQYMGNNKWLFSDPSSSPSLSKPRTFFRPVCRFPEWQKGGNHQCAAPWFSTMLVQCVLVGMAWVDMMFDAYTRPKVVVVVLVYQQFVMVCISIS